MPRIRHDRVKIDFETRRHLDVLQVLADRLGVLAALLDHLEFHSIAGDLHLLQFLKAVLGQRRRSSADAQCESTQRDFGSQHA
jgi:hypothetical protein